jgi:ABC-type sugar transport system substrate-binding protein
MVSSRRRALASVLVAAIAVVGITSVSSAASKPRVAARVAASKVHIAFLNESITSYTIPMTDSMQSTAAAHNASVRMFNANNDPSTQLSQCESAISSGQYQAILEYPVDGAAAVPCAQRAIAAHIKFIPVDSPVGPNASSTAVQVPGIQAQVLGEALPIDASVNVQLVKEACSHFKAPCTIVQTESIPAFFYCAYKVSHEQPALKKLGYKILATLVIGNFDDASGMKSAILTELAKNPHFDVILSDDDSSVQGAVQLKQQGKLPNTLIVADGGSTVGVKAIKSGLMFGSAMSVPRSESARAVLDAIALVHGHKVSPVTVTQKQLTATPAITKANVNKVTPQW